MRNQLACAEIEALQQRRGEHFRVLKAVTELLPQNRDTDGCAAGTVSVPELSVYAGVSQKAVARALEHWREWRVLWLWWKGGRVWDVRFQRTVVDALLSA